MIPNFKEVMRTINPGILRFDNLLTLQVNLGNICNQHCEHCHIAAGPAGDRIMNKEVMEEIILFLKKQEGLILDVTGGCPEMNPHFKFFVEEARNLVSRLMVRTNLTVFGEEGMDWIPEWYKEHQVVLMASLPCYTEEKVDMQRGNGVFKKSINALVKLNELGYGTSLELELNLVCNPGGDFLPASQKKLEEDYKEQLFEKYGIRFNSLFTIVNAPLGRFMNYLESNGLTEQYFRLLFDNLNPDIADNIMCRTLINVDWQGILYNCDFNLASGLPIRNRAGKTMKINDMQDVVEERHDIVMDNHCYCCTAGAGSSCTGVLAG